MLRDKRLPISGGEPESSPLAMGRNFTEEGGDRFRKIPLPERVSRRISRAEIFAKIERKYPKHILETAE